MGAQNSNPVDQITANNVIQLNYLNDIDSKNPEIYLNQISQINKNKILESWSILKSDVADMGSLIFLELFAQNKNIKDSFAIFKDKNLEQIRVDPELANHGLRVMSSIEKLIHRLDQPDKIREMIKSLGHRHQSYSANSVFVPLVGDRFISTIEPRLQDKNLWTEDLQKDWIVIVSYLCVEIMNSMTKTST